MGKKLKSVLKWVIYYPLLVLTCLEVALLILGYRRYQDKPYVVSATPENAFIGDDSLGIYLNPGKYSIILNNAIEFETEHLCDNRRLNHHEGNIDKPKVVFLGCSFTYGYGVNNDETFIAQLQGNFPNYNLENYGVVGYGTVQALLQLSKILTDTSVKAVLLDFSSFHFMRNVLSQNYRRNLKIGYANSNEKTNNLMQNARFPFLGDCSDSIRFANWRDLHSDWYGRNWFASVNWIQTLTESYHDKKLNEIEITTYVIQQIAAKCEAANVRFGIVCLDQTAETDILQKNLFQLPWLDVKFDFSDTDLTLLPHDSHPSAKGHLEIAHKILPFLTSILRNE